MKLFNLFQFLNYRVDTGIKRRGLFFSTIISGFFMLIIILELNMKKVIMLI